MVKIVVGNLQEHLVREKQERRESKSKGEDGGSNSKSKAMPRSKSNEPETEDWLVVEKRKLEEADRRRAKEREHAQKKAKSERLREEAKKKTEEEAKKKADEEAKKKANEEANKKAEKLAKAKEEAKKKAEKLAKAKEEAKKKAEKLAKAKEEAKKKKEDEMKKQKGQEEELMKARNERLAKEKSEAAIKKAEEAQKKKAEAAQKKKSEEAQKKKSETAQKKKSEEAQNREKSRDSMALVTVPQPIADEPPNVDDVDTKAKDRDEFHVAEIVEEFAKEEVHIRHDEIPESDNEGDERYDRGRYKYQFRRGDGTMYVGQTFYNRVAFKECVIDYCLNTGYNVKQYRHDRDKIGFRCVGSENCKFQVYASSLPHDPTWRIRILKEDHACIPNGQCDMIMIPVIARLFVDKIRDEPDYYMPQKIEQIILEKWKISVSRTQCQFGRAKALKWLEAEADHQFARMRDYKAEILRCNEGYTVVIDTIQKEGKDMFSRFYVCFDVLRKTWKQTCRPLIGVDGCFLKNKVKGQLLVAIGRDADNVIYPIAWSVVQVENKENWLWFMRMMKQDLDLADGDGFIMVSDRQKGLIKAVELELPKMEHRMFVRHIYANLKKDHAHKLQMKPLVWNLAWS